MRMDKERMKFLKRELAEYEKITPMTEDERKALREWVDAGYSVHENTDGAQHGGVGGYLDFLDVYRIDEEIRRATVGMSGEEARKYALAYYGWDDPQPEEKEYTVDSLKNKVRELQRELFYVWDIIQENGLWDEATEYVSKHRGEPIPFEME